MAECGKKDTCKNYDKKCSECWAISSIYDTHPCYTNKDLVEVVRCKDCSYIQTHVCAITGAKTLFCDYWDKPYPVEEEHYCGYGKRTQQKEG